VALPLNIPPALTKKLVLTAIFNAAQTTLSAALNVVSRIRIRTKSTKLSSAVAVFIVFQILESLGF
jgi:hypothetical protein